MRNRSVLTKLLIALTAGIVAVALATQWLGRKANLATTRVVIAARDVPVGVPLTAEQLKVTDWPSGAVPEGALAEQKALEGRVTRAALSRGEPILEAKLAPPGTRGGLSAMIAPGKRAITVKVNEVVGVAGFALPGTLVDVLVNARDDTDRPVSRIVLERILVLAVAQEANRDETKPKVVSAVTLEVSPEQAEKIDLARAIGTLSLVLRNQLDDQPALTDGARRFDLLREAAPPAPEKRIVAQPARMERAPSAPAPKPNGVEVLKGMQRSYEERGG